MDQQRMRRRPGLGDRDEVLVRIVRHLGVEAWIDDVARGHEQDGIAVARRLGGGAHAEIAGGAALISITNCCPSFSDSFCPISRATTSVGPPAGNGTMMRTGLLGYCCAHVVPDSTSAAQSAAIRMIVVMVVLLCAAFDVPQSILILASSMTFDHFTVSLLMRSPNSAGVSATGSKPSVSSFSLMSGNATSFLISPLSRSTISLGVPAGTTMPVSVSPS